MVARAPGPSLAASAPPRAPGPESQRVLILFKPPTWQVLLWGHPGPHQNIPKTGSLWHLSDCKLAGSSAHPHALVRTESWDWVLPLLPSSSQLPLNSLSLHTQGPHLPRVTPLRVIGCEQMFTGNLEFLFRELLVYYIVYLSSPTELFLINFKGFFKEQEC